MAMTQAQKEAIQRYRKKRGGVQGLQKTISATVSPSEAVRIKSILQSIGMTNAEALKRVAARIEQGDDLRRDYDPVTNSLKKAPSTDPTPNG